MTAVPFGRPLGKLPFTFHHIDCLPTKPAIYAFWFKHRCLYVGQARNVRARLIHHWHHSHNVSFRQWVEAYRQSLAFEYAPCARDVLTEEELRTIRVLRPETNIQHSH